MPIGAIAGIAAKALPALGGLFGGGGKSGLGALGGLLGGLFGGGDGKFEQDTKSIQDVLEKFNQSTKGGGQKSGRQDVDIFDEAVENPLFGAFREGLLPVINQEINRARNTPVYGEGQKAGLLNNLNELAEAASGKLKSQLARQGASDSGLLATGLGDIEQTRLGEAAKFFTQLPFMEEEARSGKVGNLLGLASSFAGRAPISQRRKGFTTDEEDYSSFQDITGQSDKHMEGTSSTRGKGGGPGILGRIGSGIGGFLGGGSLFGGGGMRRGGPAIAGKPSLG